jgi:drug/metabolite transporter (DMT)-like permease
MIWSAQSLLLVLGCSLAWSGLDALRKVLTRHLSPLSLVLYLTLGQIPVLALWCLGAPLPEPSRRYALLAAASVALNILANLAFVEAVRRSPLSLTVPLLSLTPVLATALAVPLLGELPTPRQTLGILLVVAGAAYLGGQTESSTAAVSWWRKVRGEPGVPLMLAVAGCWSLTLPIDKLAMQEVAPRWHALVLSAGVALGTMLLLAAMGRLAELRFAPTAFGALTLAVLVSASALALQLVAMQQVLVGLLETVKRCIGNFMALAMGALLFQEPITVQRALALTTMAAGVVLVLM